MDFCLGFPAEWISPEIHELWDGPGNKLHNKTWATWAACTGVWANPAPCAQNTSNIPQKATPGLHVRSQIWEFGVCGNSPNITAQKFYLCCPFCQLRGKASPWIFLEWGHKITFPILMNKKGGVCKYPAQSSLANPRGLDLPVFPLLGLITATSMDLVHWLLHTWPLYNILQRFYSLASVVVSHSCVLGKILCLSKHFLHLWIGCSDVLLFVKWMFLLFLWPSLTFN